jgi:DNA-binding XRE family transcriptional regulator
MIKYEALKTKLLLDPEVKKEYEECGLEYEIAHALILARTEAKMTQDQVAQKMHTTQSVIARLESGRHFPSLQTIHKYAIAVGRAIDLHVCP